MKLLKLSLAAALAVTVAFAQESKSDIGVSANVAITSNYVWRGMTQTDNSPAIQGGFDIDYKGIYAGVWGSNINFGDDESSMELDLYVGYSNEIAGLTYDLGYVQFTYPNDSDALNFGEAYLGLSYDFEVVEIGATYYMGVSTNDWEDVPDTIEASVSVPLPYDMSIDATGGNYDTVGTYYSAGVTKTFKSFDFTVAYTGMDFDDDASDNQDNVVATISASF